MVMPSKPEKRYVGQCDRASLLDKQGARIEGRTVSDAEQAPARQNTFCWRCVRGTPNLAFCETASLSCRKLPRWGYFSAVWGAPSKVPDSPTRGGTGVIDADNPAGDPGGKERPPIRGEPFL